MYAQSFAEKGHASRQAYLKERYFFQCECQACLNKWPTASAMPKSFDDLEDGQLKIDPSDGMSIFKQVSKIQKLGSNISQEQKAGNYKKAFSYCIEFIRLLEETIERPHSYYLMAETTMYKLAWILYGALKNI